MWNSTPKENNKNDHVELNPILMPLRSSSFDLIAFPREKCKVYEKIADDGQKVSDDLS